MIAFLIVFLMTSHVHCHFTFNLKPTECETLQNVFQLFCPMRFLEIERRQHSEDLLGSSTHGDRETEGTRSDHRLTGPFDSRRFEEEIRTRLQEDFGAKMNNMTDHVLKKVEKLIDSRLTEGTIDQVNNISYLQSDVQSLTKELRAQVRISLDLSSGFENATKALEVQKEIILNHTSTLEKTKNKMKGLCPVSYDGKCFAMNLRFPSVIIRNEAERICNDRGGELANIYSENHYTELMNYVRTFIPDGQSQLYFWTGMTYDSNLRKVNLSDGRDAPFVKWYSGYPSGSNTYVTLHTHRTRNSASQHLVNDGSGAGLYGVICEM